MTSAKRQWLFPLLLPNLAVAAVVLIQIAWNQITNTRELLHVLTYDLIYANLVAALGVLLVGLLPQVLVCRRLSMAWTLALCFFGIVPLGILLVQGLLMVLGLAVPEKFWLQYLQTLRVSMPLAVVFGSGAIFFAFLRNRLEITEQKLHEKEIAAERSRKLVAEARLHSLESRIHPHFLFNTLNSISSLIPVNPPQAERILGRLAALLRASLDSSNRSLIPLREELAMVESYMEIEKARFANTLRTCIDVPAELQCTEVPPMSVQTLVENAVKYGITPRTDGGEVRVIAFAENGKLRVEVRDSGPGFDLAVVPAGHGLDNLVERLNALFGDKAKLNVFQRDTESVVEMVLPRV